MDSAIRIERTTKFRWGADLSFFFILTQIISVKFNFGGETIKYVKVISFTKLQQLLEIKGLNQADLLSPLNGANGNNENAHK